MMLTIDFSLSAAKSLSFDNVLRHIFIVTCVSFIYNIYYTILINLASAKKYFLNKKGALYYRNTDFKELIITSIIVPLYDKIYLDALYAHELMMSVLKNEQIGYNIINNNGNKNEIVLRVFLTSSRSFKNKIATNESVHEILKDFILLTSMPKFIWVAEISNRDLYSRKKAFGLIIVDATGNASLLYETILILMYPDKIIKFNSKEHKFDFINNDFGVFDIYKNNLKGAWSNWQAE